MQWGEHRPDLSLQVDIYIMAQPLSGKWVHYGTEVTSGSGRLSYTLPEEKMLGIGMYPIRMVVRWMHGRSFPVLDLLGSLLCARYSLLLSRKACNTVYAHVHNALQKYLYYIGCSTWLWDVILWTRMVQIWPWQLFSAQVQLLTIQLPASESKQLVAL